PSASNSWSHGSPGENLNACTRFHSSRYERNTLRTSTRSSYAAIRNVAIRYRIHSITPPNSSNVTTWKAVNSDLVASRAQTTVNKARRHSAITVAIIG